MLDFDKATVDMRTLGVEGFPVLKAHGGHFAVRIVDYPEAGHPGLLIDCHLASLVPEHVVTRPEPDHLNEDMANGSEASDSSYESDGKLGVQVEIVDDECFPDRKRRRCSRCLPRRRQSLTKVFGGPWLLKRA